MRRSALTAIVVVVIASVLAAGLASTRSDHVDSGSNVGCQSAAPPLAALPPAVPVWCDTLATAVDTAIRMANSWSDDFASGASHARLPGSYIVFENSRRVSSCVARFHWGRIAINPASLMR